MIINNVGSYINTTGCAIGGFGGIIESPTTQTLPFVGPLDDYTTNLFAARSVSRRLLSSFSSPLLRVRRGSDNAELDIGFHVLGGLDEAALLAFVGAGNGYVSIAYDQSGNGRHLTQTTAALQPQIVSGGVVSTHNGYPTTNGPANAKFVFTNPATNVGYFLNAWRNTPGTAGYLSIFFLSDSLGVATIGDATVSGGWTIFDAAFAEHQFPGTLQNEPACFYFGATGTAVTARVNLEAYSQTGGTINSGPAFIGDPAMGLRFMEDAMYSSQPADINAVQSIFLSQI
jgi:hypothetical protein